MIMQKGVFCFHWEPTKRSINLEHKCQFLPQPFFSVFLIQDYGGYDILLLELHSPISDEIATPICLAGEKVKDTGLRDATIAG